MEPVVSHALASPWTGAVAARADEAPSIEALFDAQYDFVWRTVRRLGLSDAEADDAAQQVFVVVARKLDRVVPGSERSFVYAVALRVVADARKNVARGRAREAVRDVDVVDARPSAEVALDEARARAAFDEVVGAMPLPLRTVFVLFELEGLSTPEIAALEGIPVGTAASRLRRARATYEDALRGLRARFAEGGAS